MKLNLEKSFLYEHKDDMAFTVVKEIDITNLKHGQITMRGKSYDYDYFGVDGTSERESEIVIDVTEDGVYQLNEKGEIID